MVYLTVDEVAADIRQRITTGKLWIGAYLSDEILAEYNWLSGTFRKKDTWMREIESIKSGETGQKLEEHMVSPSSKI
jgi:hypothetical protein